MALAGLGAMALEGGAAELATAWGIKKLTKWGIKRAITGPLRSEATKRGTLWGGKKLLRKKNGIAPLNKLNEHISKHAGRKKNYKWLRNPAMRGYSNTAASLHKKYIQPEKVTKRNEKYEKAEIAAGRMKKKGFVKEHATFSNLKEATLGQRKNLRDANWVNNVVQNVDVVTDAYKTGKKMYRAHRLLKDKEHKNHSSTAADSQLIKKRRKDEDGGGKRRRIAGVDRLNERRV